MYKHNEKFLRQSLLISEGAVAELLKLIFLKGPLKRALTQLNKKVETDPEIQAGLADWEYHTKRMTDLMNDFCKKYPERCK
jgi:hypothetical protein